MDVRQHAVVHLRRTGAKGRARDSACARARARVCEDVQEAPHQHPAARVPGVGPTHDHGVVHLLDDRDEVVTLQLREGGRDGVIGGGEEEEEGGREHEKDDRKEENGGKWRKNGGSVFTDPI